jgi:putative endopeptidase
MKRIIRSAVSIMLSFVMLTGTAYAAEKVPGQKWIDADTVGNVTEDTQADLRDNFALAVNKDWILNTELPSDKVSTNAYNELNDEVREKITALIQSGSGTSHEAQLVSRLYGDFADMTYRNSLGIEPARPYIDEILNIRSLDELSTFLSDPDRQLTSPLMGISISADSKDSSKQAVYLYPQMLSLDDADEYANTTALGQRRKSANETGYVKFLKLFGVSEEEAEQRYQAMFALETQLASAEDGTSVQKQENYNEISYNPTDLNTLLGETAVYPAAAVLKPYTDLGIRTFIMTEPKWYAKLNKLYTEENLEAWKDILLYEAENTMITSLNQECLDIYDEKMSEIYQKDYQTNPEKAAYTRVSALLDMAIGRMYCDAYVTEQTKQDVKNLVNQVISCYRKRLANESWLSEGTRKKAVEKLDAIIIRVAYPDDWSLYDYSGLNFKDRNEGGNLVENLRAIYQFDYEKSLKDAVKPTDKQKWFASPQTVNGFYYSSDNSINIPAGILGGVFYDPDKSEASNMGGVGMTIGHEISHAFDSNGSQYDKNGNLNSWWTEEDRAAFRERVKKVENYYATFEPISGIHVDGELTKGETVADLGGMTCLLEIAKSKENFSYSDFFSNWARKFRGKMTAGYIEELLQQDPHAPQYLRINVTAQQFQEFYDTFGVVEGDNMYLAPEERFLVW